MDEGKKRYLFWDYDERWKYMKVDDVALYSVTPCKYAAQIARIALDFLPAQSVVVDATACVGGDTACLAKVFDSVIAIEENKGRFEMLNHNLNYMLRQREHVRTVRADFVKWWQNPNRTHVDGVYIDPPWEGQLRLGGIALWDIVETIRRQGIVVIVKLPPQAEVEVETRAKVLLKSSKGEEKMMIIVV